MSLDLSWTIACAAGAAWVATEAARELAADVDLALRRARLSRKEVAGLVGLPEPKLSDCLSCTSVRVSVLYWLLAVAIYLAAFIALLFTPQSSYDPRSSLNQSSAYFDADSQ